MRYSTLSIIALLGALVCTYLAIQSLVDPDVFGYTVLSRETRINRSRLEGSSSGFAIAAAMFFACYLWCRQKYEQNGTKERGRFFHAYSIITKSIWENKVLSFYIKAGAILFVLLLAVLYYTRKRAEQALIEEDSIMSAEYFASTTPYEQTDGRLAYSSQEIKKRVRRNLPGVVEFAGYLNSIGQDGDGILLEFNNAVSRGKGEDAIKVIQDLAKDTRWTGDLLADKFTDDTYPHFKQKK